MKILFLLSSLEPAGSETYCVSLADAWRGKHETFWISDQLHFGQTYQSMPIHAKAIPMGVVNTFRVAAFARRNKIQLIHSHSRRAHWVGAQAAALAGIPHVTTIHQPLPVHFFSKTFPCLGDQTIAIDEAIVDHLQKYFGRSREKIHLIRNGINLLESQPSQRPPLNMKQVLLIGRLTGGRWRTFQFFLDVLERTAKTLPPAQYKIVGQIPVERHTELTRRLATLNDRLKPATITSVGYVKDLQVLIRNSDAGIAAGRSALECLAQGRPVILLGEGGVLGLAKPQIWLAALRTNLGDHIDPKDFDPLKLETALRELLTPRSSPEEASHWAGAQIEKDFDSRTVAAQVETVYRRALAS